MACDILVVDDDPTIRAFIAEALTEDGYEVCEADNGLKGLHLARDHQPRVVIMDLMMPVLDGATAIRRLKADPTTQAMRVVVASAEVGVLEAASEIAVDAVLPKPFELESLKGVVTELLAAESSR